jgi:hypothetical protein
LALAELVPPPQSEVVPPSPTQRKELHAVIELAMNRAGKKALGRADLMKRWETIVDEVVRDYRDQRARRRPERRELSAALHALEDLRDSTAALRRSIETLHWGVEKLLVEAPRYGLMSPQLTGFGGNRVLADARHALAELHTAAGLGVSDVRQMVRPRARGHPTDFAALFLVGRLAHEWRDDGLDLACGVDNRREWPSLVRLVFSWVGSRTGGELAKEVSRRLKREASRG